MGLVLSGLERKLERVLHFPVWCVKCATLSPDLGLNKRVFLSRKLICTGPNANKCVGYVEKG